MGSFVGRAAELGRLRRMVEDCGGGLALVVGPAGVGKTALVDELWGSALGDRRVLRGRAVSGCGRFGWWDRVGRALGVTPLHADLTLAVAEREQELAELVALALRERAPAMLVLEDAHWADESSKRVLSDVIEDLVGVDVVVVVTSRSRADVTEMEERVGHSELVLVRPFDDIELATVFESARDRPPADEELAALRARTGGIALLVRETLAGGDGRSPAVQSVLASSLSRLSGEATTTISLLAIAGPGTPSAVLAAAADSTEATIADHLAEAASVGVVDDDEMWFRHDLFADAAADLLDATDRRAAHVSIAAAWDGLGDPTGERVAHHLLAGVPEVRVDDAVPRVCDAAAALRAVGRAGDAADLLDAADVERVTVGLSPTVRTRLLLELGECHWQLGEAAAALESFASADQLGQSLDDVELAARAAIAAQRRHNPFIPDPDARTRLARLDEALGDRDSGVRVELLGRRSVLARQPPSDRSRAEELALDALAMARRVDDPGLIAGALRDRFVCCSSPDELDERTRAAEEILGLARREGSPEWLLVGYEWQAAGCLDAGDLAAAARSIAELEATATVMRSGQWRMSALLRRTALLALFGDRDGALERAAELSALVGTAAAPHEVIGAQLGLRGSIAMLYRVLDPGLPELLEAGWEMFDAAPASFVQIAQSTGSILLGDLDAARRRALPWLAQPATAFDGPSPLNTLSMMAECVVELSLADHAGPLLELLEPFQGRNCMDLGTHADLPVDYRLADLALLVGDHQRAATYALASVDLGRRVAAPPVEARSLALLADVHAAAGESRAAAVARDRAEALAEPIGLVLDAPWREHASRAAGSSRAASRTVAFIELAERWQIRDGTTDFEVPSSRGFTQLARLVAAPGTEVNAVELAGHHDAGAAPVEAGLGPLLDARAKREYRHRIMELNADIDDADHANDPERAARARIELDAVMDELRRATGLGDRDRPQRSGAEKARVNVTRSLRRAIAAIERHDTELGAHLQLAVQTGTVCSYRPDPSSSITIEVTQ